MFIMASTENLLSKWMLLLDPHSMALNFTCFRIVLNWLSLACVCMYACVCICMYIDACVCMYVCMCVHMYVYRRMCVYVCMYVCVRTYACCEWIHKLRLAHRLKKTTNLTRYLFIFQVDDTTKVH